MNTNLLIHSHQITSHLEHDNRPNKERTELESHFILFMISSIDLFINFNLININLTNYSSRFVMGARR